MNKTALLILILTRLALPLEGIASELGDLQPIGTMGKGQRVLKGGKEAPLFEHQGAGCLTHFWFGGNFKGVEETRIRYYVDGEETPSIDMALYMGHGIGFNGMFHADIAGLTHFDKNDKSFSAYRFHDDDPIIFQDGLRLTCRCGETEHGQTGGKQGYLNPPKTRYTTYTWVYQW